MTNKKAVALPKFGEWDLKNPGTSEFSVIFEKARNAKREGHPHKFNPNSPFFKKEAEPQWTPAYKNKNNVSQSQKRPKGRSRRGRSGVRRWFCCSAPTRYAES
ncbi:hypothetical protein ACET3Z_009791 [Daucus carota]